MGAGAPVKRAKPMISCFIALGSNLDNPQEHVNRAVQELANLPTCQLIACSPWYQSQSIGPGKQDDYINGVVELHTTLPPLQLLDALQTLENNHHRVRAERWGPRTLDLDILLFGREDIHSERLTVPHPRMLERDFVLYPLFDIAPELVFNDGSSLSSRLNSCPNNGLLKLEQLCRQS